MMAYVLGSVVLKLEYEMEGESMAKELRKKVQNL